MRSAPPKGAHSVSGLPFASEVNSWGPVERDRSNGEQAATDGRPISIGGVRYQTGLGVHAASSVRIYLGAACSVFSAQAGVDDETDGRGHHHPLTTWPHGDRQREHRHAHGRARRDGQ
ncbi:NPCBM/NEW2 domain-containing protein [Crossiella sp. NPDC003009]